MVVSLVLSKRLVTLGYYRVKGGTFQRNDQMQVLRKQFKGTFKNPLSWAMCEKRFLVVKEVTDLKGG